VATQLDDGGFAASVSIRSGKGSATHDRVSRFSTLFDNAPAALHYATEHALAWIGERNTAAHARYRHRKRSFCIYLEGDEPWRKKN
jgi:hypothetical protein